MKRRRPEEVRAKLKAMGLGDAAIKRCMATFHEAGEQQALQQAQAIVDHHKAILHQARMLACKILGLPA